MGNVVKDWNVFGAKVVLKMLILFFWLVGFEIYISYFKENKIF